MSRIFYFLKRLKVSKKSLKSKFLITTYRKFPFLFNTLLNKKNKKVLSLLFVLSRLKKIYVFSKNIEKYFTVKKDSKYKFKILKILNFWIQRREYIKSLIKSCLTMFSVYFKVQSPVFSFKILKKNLGKKMRYLKEQALLYRKETSQKKYFVQKRKNSSISSMIDFTYLKYKFFYLCIQQ